jgi:hypothetical protein
VQKIFSYFRQELPADISKKKMGILKEKVAELRQKISNKLK